MPLLPRNLSQSSSVFQGARGALGCAPTAYEHQVILRERQFSGGFSRYLPAMRAGTSCASTSRRPCLPHRIGVITAEQSEECMRGERWEMDIEHHLRVQGPPSCTSP
eukprot:6465773-Amphidinium_carterae.1